jgi:hypothetical protein
MHSVRCYGFLCARRAVFSAVLAGSLLGAPVRAQQPAGGSTTRIDDRWLGEEERIRRRLDWFYERRRAGTSSEAERAKLRYEGVLETRRLLELQRGRREAGLRGQDNFWVAKGPSPSTFGGWGFGPVSGRISSITADWASGTLYLGTASGGMWRSTNDGASWEQLLDTAGTMTVGTVAVDPNDSDVIWVGTGENGRSCESYFGIGLLRSADGGATWELRNGSGSSSLEDLASFADIVVDPRDSGHIVTGGRIRDCVNGQTLAGGIYTSDDAGTSWTRRLAVDVYEIVQDPAVRDTFWAATGNGIYKSVDNAESWSLQTASGLPSGGVGRSELAVAPSNSNVVYALFASGPQLWRTTDGGTSWTQMAAGDDACDGQCWYNMVLRVHRINPDIVFRGTVHIFKSFDGGVSWSDLSNGWGPAQTVHQDTHAFLMHPSDPDTFYVGGDGGLWKSVDGGNSFANRNGNLNITQFYAVGVAAGDTETICGGAQDNSSLVRTTGDVWDLQTVTGDGFVCHFDPVEADYAYNASYPSGGYPRVNRSTDGPLGPFFGITAGGTGINQGDRISWVTPYVLDPVSPSTLYLGTHRVYRSDDHGSSWSQVGPDDMTGGSGALVVVDVNRSFPSYVHAGSSSGRVWRTVDGGASWDDITSGLPARTINDLAGDPTDPDRVFAVVSGFNTEHLWRWTPAEGWVAIGAGLPNVPANTVLVLSALDVMVGTDTGVFRSTDGGVTVQPFMAGLPQGVVVMDLKHDVLADVVTAGTYGRGAWQAPIAPVGPILVFDSVVLPATEVDGDGDGNAEPGETWGVQPVLRNAGGDDALGVQARLVTGAPGVVLLDAGPADFGDIIAGTASASLQPIEFTIDPDFDCGATISFDLVDVTTTNPPHTHAGRTAAVAVEVLDDYDTPLPEAQLDEDFDPPPAAGWTHEAVNQGVAPCAGFPYFDEWGIASKDAEHGDSFHCGGGPGGTYTLRDFSWLYYGGKDSTNGAGIDVPAGAAAAALTITHWYDTDEGFDGGQVLIDAEEDDQDVYVTLVPEGGYPGEPLAAFFCNALEGREAFQGSSGGWVTDTFDLTPYLGRRIYLAFAFASDYQPSSAEGWYVDEVRVESLVFGAPLCDVAQWPGSVPATVRYELTGPDTIEASWSDACNVAEFPTQAYSVQAGNLDQLAADGTYSHAPLAERCDLSSPAPFTPGAGNEYYLLVPTDGIREGGAGTDSAGAERPATGGVCGVRRARDCP